MITPIQFNYLFPGEQEYSNQTTSTHVAIPPQAHHFTFSIDLRSIKDVDSSNTLFVYLKLVFYNQHVSYF